MSYLKKIHSFNNMGTWPIYEKSYIVLPVLEDGKSVDYAFMETYISAIKKQCIAALKKEFDIEHKAYEKVVSEDNATIKKKTYKLYIETDTFMAAEGEDNYNK